MNRNTKANQQAQPFTLTNGMHVEKRTMNGISSAYLFGWLVISSCKPSEGLTLIEVENKLDSRIYIELWGYP